MKQPPIEFYDRSRAFATVVGARGGPPLRILLSASSECAATKTGQLILEALCDIFPRISERYTEIDLCVPDVSNSLSAAGRSLSLPEAMISRLVTICPWGKFAAVATPRADYDFCVSLGPQEWPCCRRVVYAHASGWRVFVASDAKSIALAQSDFNPFACLAAAALSAMAIYAEAEGISRLKACGEIHGWSVLDFSISRSDGPPLPREIEVGTVVQAGLGGSASALLWALRHGPALKGRWVAFEHECLDFSNGNRYLLMTPSDYGLAKGLVAKREFDDWHRGLQFDAVQGRIEESCRGIPRNSTVLATVDDETIRVHLQQQYPAILLNVGTASQYLSLSRHALTDIRQDRAPCLQCLYREPRLAERRQREATVSFVAALVGALLGAELVKALVLPEYSLRYAWLGNIFQPTAARAYLPARFSDCPACIKLIGMEGKE